MEKITCKICKKYESHVLVKHIIEDHNIEISEYIEKHGNVFSAFAAQKLAVIKSPDFRRLSEISIEKTFNVKVSDKKESIKSYTKPHKTTPKIEEGYVFDKDILKLILYTLEHKNERLLLTGPTGCGKSSVIMQTCAKLNLPFYRINFDVDITRADFIGQWVVKGDQMIFEYGILPKAIKEGAVLLLDEIDCINPSVGMVLQSVLEGSPLSITETGEVIELTDNFKIFGTSNTVGRGDESGLYAGTTIQNFATMDRWTMVENVDYPSNEIEKNIIIKRTGVIAEKGDDFLVNLLKFANNIRSSFKKQECMCIISTRTLINIVKKLFAFGDLKKATEICFLNRLSSDDKEFAGEVYQRIFG